MVGSALIWTAAAGALASHESLSLFQHAATVRMAGRGSKIAAYKEELTDWNMCSSEVHSNLGGLGGVDIKEEDGPSQARELRYKTIAKFPDGRGVDLVITNTSVYLPNPDNPKQARQAGDRNIGAQWMNGRNGCLGRFNINSPGEVSLKFVLAYSGTNTPISLQKKVDFTIFDFDTSQYGMVEQITVTGIDSWVEGNVKPVAHGDEYVFTGDKNNVNVDNPEDPYDLTPEQMNACVGLVYATSEWEIKFSAIDSTNSGTSGGRNFLFAGKTLLQDKGTPMTTTTTTCVRDESGVCVVYQDPHIDGFDNPSQGPFLTRVTTFDSIVGVQHKMSLVGTRDTSAWYSGGSPSLDVNVYDIGDFWLVKNELVHIQGRYNTSVEFGGSRSGLSAVAIGGNVLGGGKILVEPKNGAVVAFGDRVLPVQEYIKDTPAGQVSARTYYNAYTEGGVAASGIDIALPAKIFLQIRRYNTHLDAKITMPHSAGVTDGQCGNFNGDPHDDSLEEVENRMANKISPEELLFAKLFVE